MAERDSLWPSEPVGAACAVCGAPMPNGPAYVEVRWAGGREQVVEGIGDRSNDCAPAQVIEALGRDRRAQRRRALKRYREDHRLTAPRARV
jgi:hypothetical protein